METSIKKSKKIFITGPINPQFIADSIAKHSSRTDIGAHDIFLGQVREDKIKGKKIRAIEYSAYNEMAEKEIHDIRENTFKKFGITCIHIYHSLGRVKAGKISFFVFVSAPHRDAAFKACRYVVDEIKKKAPVFGKEIFEDNSHQWKKNN